MTKLLDHAISKARGLPEAEQDALAVAVLALSEGRMEPEPLDDETRAAILRGLDQARRGDFVPEAEIEALWRKHGL